jgi:LL-diaminopimelate aminotransferase
MYSRSSFHLSFQVPFRSRNVPVAEGVPVEKKSVLVSAAGRIGRLPPYLFAELDRARSAAIRKGIDLIDFGIGDPDLPTPPEVVEEAVRALHEPAFHRYPSNRGAGFFLEAVSDWLRREFGVATGDEIAAGALIGSKEGLAHVPSVFCDPGDLVLVPSPGYPVYRAAAILADAVPIDLPLKPENGFLPDLESLDRSVVRASRMLFLNYPNNPTGAQMDEVSMRAAVDFARRNDLLLVSDASYSHMRLDGGRPASFLGIEGAAPICLEFHSMSKTFNMTGWRVGFVAGGRGLVEAFMSAKENIDSGVFTVVQKAAARAMELPSSLLEERRAVYSRRRRLLASGLERLRWEIFPAGATFYLWARVPRGWASMDFASWLISRAGIVVTPGAGFGTWGEGWVRFALTLPEDRIEKALGRLEQLELHSFTGRHAVRRRQ